MSPLSISSDAKKTTRNENLQIIVDRLSQKWLLRVIVVRNQGKHRNLRYNYHIDHARVYANARFYARYANKGDLGIVNSLPENRTNPFLFFV